MDTNNTPATAPVTPKIEVVADVNSYLKANANTLEAAFTLRPVGFDALEVVVEQNIYLLGDVSTSMVQPADKLIFMKKAMESAIIMLPESAWLCVIVFSDAARTVVPLKQATAANKKAAIELVRQIREVGGTKMSTGLREVAKNQKIRPQASAEVIMLTDGANNDDDARNLTAALGEYQEAAKAGNVIQIHARGVGRDFVMNEVRRIADATKGKAPEYIDDPKKLEADFGELIEAAAKNTVTDVRLNIWMPNVVKLNKCSRSIPSIQDIMGTQTIDTTSGQTHTFPLGALGAEPVEYFTEFGLTPKPVGQPASAGKVWVSYKLNGVLNETEKLIVRAEWTAENDVRSTRIAKGVARAKGDVELADNIEEGLAALAKGDEKTATVKLGNAAKIAQAKGDDEMTAKIGAIVDIQDAASGTVRLKKGAKENRDATLKLEANSIKTVRKTAKVAGPATEPEQK